MKIAEKELKKVIKDLFSSCMVPWNKVKTVKIDWKQMEVGEDDFRGDCIQFWSDLVAVPVITITMKD